MCKLQLRLQSFWIFPCEKDVFEYLISSHELTPDSVNIDFMPKNNNKWLFAFRLSGWYIFKKQ